MSASMMTAAMLDVTTTRVTEADFSMLSTMWSQTFFT